MGTDKAYKTHLAKTHGAQVSPPKDAEDESSSVGGGGAEPTKSK